MDYFFIMTGFLCAYTLVPKLVSQKIGIIPYLKIIKHRFFRVWPVLALSFLYWWQFAPQLFNGPLWFLYEYYANNCDKLWWSKIFLVENITFYHTYDEDANLCMMVTWYIAAEFQMYLVAVITLIVYVKRRKIGFTLMIALICQSFALAIANCLKYNFVYPATNLNKYWYFFYINPYVRWYPLFIGVVWGLLYYEYSKLRKKNIFYFFEKKVVISYIIMALGLALNIFVILFPLYSWKDALDDVWHPLRVLFNAIGITMIFMPLVSNRDFYLKRFMNLRIFQILGKTSFMTYLYHESWIFVLAYTNPAFKYDYSGLRLVWFVLKTFLCTQPIAFLAHLVFEKPLLGIEGHLTKKNPVAPKDKMKTATV